LEGDLKGLSIYALPDVSEQETETLKRNTLWPKLDFVIAPLEHSTIRPTISALGGTVPRTVIHIQIEKAGRLQFGAYDRFNPGCVSFGEAISTVVLESLISPRVCSSAYEAGKNRNEHVLKHCPIPNI
jgi:hypothetical protein